MAVSKVPIADWAALLKESTKLVILEGDKASRLGNAVEIIDMAKAAGATSFAIAANDRQPTERRLHDASKNKPGLKIPWNTDTKPAATKPSNVAAHIPKSTEFM